MYLKILFDLILDSSLTVIQVCSYDWVNMFFFGVMEEEFIFS